MMVWNLFTKNIGYGVDMKNELIKWLLSAMIAIPFAIALAGLLDGGF